MWYLDPCRIEEIVLQTGEDRLVFGLDFPYNQTPEIKEALRIIADLPLTDTAKEKLLGGNLKAVLGLS
jgi:predicted TIM-barrel fold metal-dependent hydrolase